MTTQQLRKGKEFGTDAEKRSYGEPEAKLVTEGSRGDVIVKGLDDTEIKALNQSLKEDGYKDEEAKNTLSSDAGRQRPT